MCRLVRLLTVKFVHLCRSDRFWFADQIVFLRSSVIASSDPIGTRRSWYVSIVYVPSCYGSDLASLKKREIGSDQSVLFPSIPARKLIDT